MPENFNSKLIDAENASTTQNPSCIKKCKAYFSSLPLKKRVILIVAAALILFLLFGLMGSNIKGDPVNIVKNSYLSGYPNATMGEILDAGQIKVWSSRKSDTDNNLYIVKAGGGGMNFEFLVDVKESAWQLNSFSSAGSTLTGQTMNMAVGNLLDSWYVVAEYQNQR